MSQLRKVEIFRPCLSENVKKKENCTAVVLHKIVKYMAEISLLRKVYVNVTHGKLIFTVLQFFKMV